MQDHGRLKPFEPTTFFPDGNSSRDLVPGTVPRTPHFTTTIAQQPGQSESFPVPLTRQLLDRGRERYDIFCAVCHGASGYGDGMVVQRGFTPPPSFHLDRLRAQPPGHVVAVISNGFGAMYSYADRIPPDDRWAIAAYIKALQLSQRAPQTALNDADRKELSRLPK
jgi:mono/diheme cytochrome c family protein